MLGPAGKTVRCVRCGHVWLARPESESAEALRMTTPWPEPPRLRLRDPGEEPPPSPTRAEPVATSAEASTPSAAAPRLVPDPDGSATGRAERRPHATAREGGGSSALVAAWALSLAILGAAAWGAIAYRSEVMDAWPASQRLYALIGLDG